MDCRTARLLLDFARPRVPELAAPEADALHRHLADCPDCAAVQRLERRLDEPIARAMRDVPLPAGLRERLLDKVAGPLTLRWYRRKAVWSGLAAALVLLALGWYWFNPPLTQLDLAALHERANNQPVSAQAVVERFPGDGLQVAFHRGLAVEAPPRFNYNLLTYHGVCELQGQRVPFLEFQNGSNLLRVYILDGKRFDIQALAGTVLSGRVSHRVELSPDNRFGWLYEYTGGRLDRFFDPEVLPAI